MRFVTTCALLCWCATGYAVDTGAAPEVYYTVQHDARVRSGPGTEFYATQTLPAGRSVEVYRHQGDWCAIRPPTGSFCWLPADALTWQDGSDIAHTTQEVRTRIGSLLTDERNVAYVTLRRGEAVRLLEWPHDRSADSWCKIDPPAGEFRWIHRDDLTSEDPYVDDSRKAEGRSSPWREPPDSADEPRDASIQSLRESLSAIRETMQAILPEMVGEAPDSTQVVLASADELPVMELSAPPATLTPPESNGIGNDPGLLPYPDVAPGPPSSATAPFRLGSELTRIAADLAGQVSRTPATWDLAPLRRRAQTVIDVSDTAEVREQGTNLLARIAQFEDIQRRHRLLDRNPADSALADAGPSTRNAPRGLSAPQSPMDASGYDGFGWLMPVVTQNRRVPRYVLTDQQGNILQFVTPSPGLNLSRYENQKVGIYGTRGFLPTMKQPHLVAERIVSMDAVR